MGIKQRKTDTLSRLFDSFATDPKQKKDKAQQEQLLNNKSTLNSSKSTYIKNKDEF